MPPNLLWILTDEQRADSLACDGTPWAVSPRLDALAAEGVRYAAAYTPSPVCVAARAALLTGRAPLATGVLNNDHRLRADHPPFLTGPFVAAGYQVASFGKHHYGSRDLAFPLQGGLITDDLVDCQRYRVEADPAAHGVVQYPNPDRRWILAGRFPGDLAQTAELQNVRQALAWLAQRETDRPFFLRVSLNAPHTPVVATAPFDELIDPTVIDLPLDPPDAPHLPPAARDCLVAWAGAHRLSEAQVQRTRQSYYGRCAMVDHVVGVLLDEAAALGALDDTIIAFCADHGTHLGDHGFFQKQSFFDAAARVPLLLAGPGLPAGEVVRAPVSLGGLLPTFLHQTGLEAPGGVDYAPLPVAAAAAADEAVVSELDLGSWGYRPGERWVMIRRGPWKLSGYPAADGETVSEATLHRLDDDPGERRNVVDEPGAAAVVAALLADLRERDAAVRRLGGLP